MEILTSVHENFEWQEMFETLSQKMLREVHLLPQKGAELHQQMINHLSVIAMEDQEIIGHATLLHIAPNWYELGSTFVDSNHRGRHINFLMYETLLRKHVEKNILATTTNQISLHIGERLGFVTVTQNSLPRNAFEGTCICGPKKTGGSHPTHDCKLAWNGTDWNPFHNWILPCHVRVTKETLKRNSDLRVIQNFKIEAFAKNP